MSLGEDSMNAEYEGAQPLKRVGPVPMIHWKNGRACAGPPPARPPEVTGMASASADALPSADPPPPRGSTDA
jgi:hypothetical protein